VLLHVKPGRAFTFASRVKLLLVGLDLPAKLVCTCLRAGLFTLGKPLFGRLWLGLAGGLAGYAKGVRTALATLTAWLLLGVLALLLGLHTLEGVVGLGPP
jgi:hypothetical protein